MFKKTAAFSLAALALISAARADDALLGQSDYSITADFPYLNKYAFRGIELSKDCVQPTLEFAKDNLSVGIWASQPFKRSEPNEVDFSAGYKLKLTEGWEVDTGGTFYTYPRHQGGERSSTTELKLGVNGDVKGFQPGFYAYYDLTLRTTTLQTQLAYSVPLRKLGLSLDFSANTGRVFAKEGNSYNYWYAGVDVPWKLRENSTVYVGIAYTGNDHPLASSGFLVARAGVVLSF
jgi:uncharacterized protein (TIGR02001 family)